MTAPTWHRVTAGHYVDLKGGELRRYDNDVTGRGVEWVLTFCDSWVTTAPTKREAVAQYGERSRFRMTTDRRSQGETE